MTRAHVRLLGPCFKTGRMGCRLNRHRPYALTPEDPDPDRPQSESTAKQSSPVERAEEARLRRRGGEFLSLPAGQRDRRAITPTSRGHGSPSRSPSDGQQAGRGALPAESAPANDCRTQGPVREDPTSQAAAERQG